MMGSAVLRQTYQFKGFIINSTWFVYALCIRSTGHGIVSSRGYSYTTFDSRMCHNDKSTSTLESDQERVCNRSCSYESHPFSVIHHLGLPSRT